MKYIFSLIMFLATIQVSYWYDNQGFTEYKENWNTTSFKCSSQCFVVVNTFNNSDFLKISWNFSWSWVIGYWFVNWKQIIPWEFSKIEINQTIDNTFSFGKLGYYNQLTANVPVVIIIQWEVQSNNFSFELGNYSIFDSFDIWWEDFFTFDTFKPYTINLLYWPKIFWNSANYLFYWLFIIIAIVVLLTNWFFTSKTLKYFFITGITLWILYDLRMWSELISYYDNDYKTYISKPINIRTFRDRWDFYDFTDFVNNKLNEFWVKKFSNISFYTDNTRPFPWIMTYMLYPNYIQLNKETPKYFIVYESSKTSIKDNILIIDWKNIWPWKIIKFSNKWFIFIKN